MAFILALLTLAVVAPITALPLSLRQEHCSTTWTYRPGSGRDYAPPGNYRAFNLNNCEAQLSFNKDQYVSIQWAFEATYADGSRAEHKPFRDFDTFGVSDTFYPYLGNNFITRYPGSSAFTAVHEFVNVCKGGQSPVSWRFYTTTSSCFTSPRISAVGGVSRPTKLAGVSLRRVNDAGDFRVSWSPVPGATAYSVIVQYPTGTDEIGRPYLNVRGARIQGTTTEIPTTDRRKDVAREVIIHAVDSTGVWSLTKDVPSVIANIRGHTDWNIASGIGELNTKDVCTKPMLTYFPQIVAM